MQLKTVEFLSMTAKNSAELPVTARALAARRSLGLERGIVVAAVDESRYSCL
jgi:hypothetical protein